VSGTNLRGRKLRFEYDNGVELTAEYPGANELVWRALAGPAAGTEGTEIYECAEVAPEVFFVSWLERSGTSVSQVIDLVRGALVSYVTFDTPSGRQAASMEGSVKELT
jgi:hypothetical protein